MSKKTTGISLGSDPTIENPKSVLSHADGSRIANRRDDSWNRRKFLRTAALAGTGAFLGLRCESLAAEPPLETTKLKLDQRPSICVAAQYVAEEFLRAEGFTDVQYIKKSGPKVLSRP